MSCTARHVWFDLIDPTDIRACPTWRRSVGCGFLKIRPGRDREFEPVLPGKTGRCTSARRCFAGKAAGLCFATGHRGVATRPRHDPLRPISVVRHLRRTVAAGAFTSPPTSFCRAARGDRRPAGGRAGNRGYASRRGVDQDLSHRRARQGASAPTSACADCSKAWTAGRHRVLAAFKPARAEPHGAVRGQYPRHGQRQGHCTHGSRRSDAICSR